MKAAFMKETGGPEVLTFGDLPEPQISSNEVLVKVKAVAVDHLDTYIRSGKYHTPEPLPTPYIVGRDMVGIIEKVGNNVKRFKPGQRVWSNALGYHGTQGSFAEHVAVNENLAYPAPANVDDLDIVAIVHSAATACVGLVRAARLQPDEFIFVNGAGGNVGSAVIQIAAARGARVIAATSGDQKIERCKQLGAELVLDYKKNNFTQRVSELAPDGVDVYWDTSRHPDFDLSISLLKPRGRIILMAGADARPAFPVGPFYHKECSLIGFSLPHAAPEELQQYAEMINRYLEEGRLKGKIAHKLSLSEAAKAHQLLESDPDIWGKIVLVNQ